jgi:DNA-binding NarL/FixJ family response regulator
VRRHRPDIALLDIRMPVLDGLSAAEEIRRTLPATAVVMLTTFSEEEYVVRALAAGASGFVLKSGDPRELLTGVRAVRDGGAFLSPEVTRQVIAQLPGPQIARAATARSRIAELTERERAVAGLVGSGLSNAEIAGRLHVVEGTVKAHVSAILARFGLRNRVELAVLSYEAGLLPDANEPTVTRPDV